MNNSSQSNEDFGVLINSSLAEAQTRVLKQGSTFAVFDRRGEIRPLGIESHGFFLEETRPLSRLVLRLSGKRALLLSSTITDENDLLVVDATNPDFTDASGKKVKGDTVHIFLS